MEQDHSIHKSQLSDDDSRENAVADQKQYMADSKRKHRDHIRKAAENRKSETIVKKVKEQAAKKLPLWIKSIAPKVGRMLAAVALILEVVALPTLSMVTIIYNSPLAIFFSTGRGR